MEGNLFKFHLLGSINITVSLSLKVTNFIKILPQQIANWHCVFMQSKNEETEFFFFKILSSLQSVI